MSSYNESTEQIEQATKGYVMQQTMLRIKAVSYTHLRAHET